MLRQISPAQIIQFVIGINGLFWLILGIVSLFSQHTYYVSGINIYTIYGLTMIAYAIVSFGLAYLIVKHNRYIYRTTVCISVITLIFSFMDDLGLVDFIYIGFITIQTILLIKYRKILTNKPTLRNPIQ